MTWKLTASYLQLLEVPGSHHGRGKSSEENNPLTQAACCFCLSTSLPLWEGLRHLPEGISGVVTSWADIVCGLGQPAKSLRMLSPKGIEMNKSWIRSYFHLHDFINLLIWQTFADCFLYAKLKQDLETQGWVILNDFFLPFKWTEWWFE